MLESGVIVAATHHIEWLLPWWWYNYSAHNNSPVAFFDLGMTEKGRLFCREKGLLISIDAPDSLVYPKEKTPSFLAEKWEKLIGSGIWDIRLKWFKKPFAFAKTPFQKTLWIDLDCEVRSSILPLFSLLQKENELLLTKEPDRLQQGLKSLDLILPNEVAYNSGVVVYHKNAPFLSKWIKEVQNNNNIHIGDQEALARVLFENTIPYKELPIEYNWDRGLGSNSKAHIFHWHGQPGKKMIKEQIQSLSLIGIANLNL